MPFSLSNKLLLLTLLFVMVGEVLIYIPSIANFRNMWLKEKLETAALVAMATSATPRRACRAIWKPGCSARSAWRRSRSASAGQRWMIAADDMPKDIAAHHDLTMLKPFDSIRAAFQTLFSTGDRLIMVSGPPPRGQRPLRDRRARAWPARRHAPLLAQHPASLARPLGDHRSARLLGASAAVRAADAAALRRTSSPSPPRPRMRRL